MAFIARPLPFSFPDTPPVTPERFEANENLPETPRTPRKPKLPRQAALPGQGRSAVFRFELVPSVQDTPRLRIRVTTHGRSLPMKARRRLWRREYEPLEFVELERRPRMEDAPYEVEKRYARGYADGTDADDEMEGGSGNGLSPPLSPNEDSTEPPASVKLQKRIADVPLRPKVKTCASCKTKKTPLWRDSEDGTPYCNACGIRYKKYRVRCSSCLYIPRKDEKLGNQCCICGARLISCRLSR